MTSPEKINEGPIVHGWVGFDLDGTLAKYDHWRGLMHIGEPIWPTVYRIKFFLMLGIEVRIFTARMSPGEDSTGATAQDFEALLQVWLMSVCGLPALKATNTKDYDMLELYDDRAVQVEFNTGRLIGHSTRAESYHEG